MKTKIKIVLQKRRTIKNNKIKKALTIMFLLVVDLFIISVLSEKLLSEKVVNIEIKSNRIVVEAHAETLVQVRHIANREAQPPLGIEEKIKKEFGADAPMALAIAKCESSLDYKRIGDQDKQYYRYGKLYGKSCGLFQIRLFPNRPDCGYLLDIENNVKYAKQLFDKKGWKPWSCYNNGNYKKFLNK